MCRRLMPQLFQILEPSGGHTTLLESNTEIPLFYLAHFEEGGPNPGGP